MQYSGRLIDKEKAQKRKRRTKEQQTIVEKKWLTKDRLMLIECWARDGYTEKEIAQRIGISPSTLTAWKSKYKKIYDALDTGKEIVDYKVENALLKRCLGYTVTEVKTIMQRSKTTGKIEVTKYEKTEKEKLPDPNCIALWLNNRKSDQWKRNRDNIVQLTDEDSNITVNIIKKESKNDLEKEESENNNITHNINKDHKNNKEEKHSTEEDWNEVLGDEEDD